MFNWRENLPNIGDKVREYAANSGEIYTIHRIDSVNGEILIRILSSAGIDYGAFPLSRFEPIKKEHDKPMTIKDFKKTPKQEEMIFH